VKKSLGLLLLSFLWSTTAVAADKFRVAWSHYTGWEPWAYSQNAGILKKWGAKYGIEIELTLINDYVESINLYTGGKFDACAMTNMDALTIPAVGGVDSTVIIVGDFSNGNDGIVLKNGSSVKDLKGRSVKLVEFTVSHYMLARALEMNGMKERDIKTVNTSDSDIAAIFTTDKNGAVVTWNPPLQQVRNVKGAKMVFDSSQIPGEIMDLMVVRTGAPDPLKKALAGAWYEVMGIMSDKGKPATGAIEYMANVLQGGRGRRVRLGAGSQENHGTNPHFHLQQGPVRQGCEVERLRRHRVSRRHGSREQEQRKAAF
jgi:NitT/TauT family transport system substrate-binding protein